MTKEVARLYNLPNVKIVNQLKSGNTNASFLINTDVGKFVLRHLLVDKDKTEINLQIQERIAKATDLAAVPIQSINRRYVETSEIDKEKNKSISLVKYIEGETHNIIESDTIEEDYFSSIGKNLAYLHKELANEELPIKEMPRWYEGENCFNINELHKSRNQTESKYMEIKEYCKNNFLENQLIHGDIHFDNIITNHGKTWFCDFDDLCVGDYRMDIALLLFDLVIITNPFGDWQKINENADNILKAYNENSSRKDVKVEDLHKLFKLLELGFYIEFGDYDISCLEEGWVKRFLTNRKKQVEDDINVWRISK